MGTRQRPGTAGPAGSGGPLWYSAVEMRRVRLLIVLVVALAACGRKGPPLPPLIEIPETTTDLAVHQVEHDAVLTWSFPGLTRAGRELTDLGQVAVWRVEVPPGQEQNVPPERQRQLMLSRGKLLARLECKGLEAATRGRLLTYSDPLPAVEPGTTPPTLWYAVRTRRTDGTPSALSNIVSWQPRPVPAQVEGLAAEPEADGIALTWNAVDDASFRVERCEVAGGSWEAVSPPDLARTTFLDASATQGIQWRYRVRAVVKDTWGPPSAEVTVPYPDVYPPASVASFICLPEPGRVILRWEASPEPGVRYAVFRRPRGSETWTALERGTGATEFVDPSPPEGELEYAIRAVDAAGNQSEAATCTVRAGS